MSMILSGDTGVQFNDSSLQGAAASPYVLKNRIINGAMQINQRGYSGAPATNANTYTLDRWYCYTNQSSKFTVSQSSTAPTGFSNSVLITSSSAYTIGSADAMYFAQAIEGFNFYDLNWGTSNAQTITLSFWVQSSLTGTFGGALQNSSGNRSYPFSYTISSANTWTKISITIAGDTTGTWTGATNATAVNVIWNLGTAAQFSGTINTWAAANYVNATGTTNLVSTNAATLYITGVQLEIGTSATPFERRMFGNELALCQRYYETSYDYGTAIGTGGWANGTLNTVCGPASSYTIIMAQFKVTKRTAPTITWYSAKNGTAGYGTNSGGAGTDFAWAGLVQNAGMYCAAVYAASGTSGTLATAATHFVATAEL
jgi:hypothetical protein